MASIIYFVECSATSRIKIGITNDVTRRLGQLNCANCAPVRLVGAVSGSIHVERHLHQMFEADRLHGEWFKSSPDLWNIIERANIGQVSLDAIERPKRLPKEANRACLGKAILKLNAIACQCGTHNIKTRIQFAADAAGLSYWRTFDLWYGKARQISAAELQVIDAAHRAFELQTAGDD